jgi:hypothetical protein
MLKKATSGVLALLPFAVLTYWKYAPRVKRAVALLDDFFDHSCQLLILEFFSSIYGLFSGNIQQAQSRFSTVQRRVLERACPLLRMRFIKADI